MRKRNRLLAAMIVTVSLFTACKKTDTTSIDTTNNGTYKVFTLNSVTYVQNFVAGTYFIHVKIDQKYYQRKFMKF